MSDFNDYVQNNPAPATPPPGGLGGFIQTNVTNPIKSAFSSGVNEASSGYQQATSGGLGNLLTGTGHMIAGAGGALFSPLAPVIQRPLGAGVNTVSNAISDNPQVQQFANSPAGQTTANIASGVNLASNVVGTVAGGMQGADTIGNIWAKAYNKFGSSASQALDPQLSQIINNHITSANQVLGDSETMASMNAKPVDVVNHAQTNIADSLQAAGENNLASKVRAIDTSSMSTPEELKAQIDSITNPTASGKLGVATAQREAAASTGVSNLNQMTEQVGNFKNDLGTNFKQGAQQIEQTNPTARLNLTTEQLDALQTLKNNKSFNLPDYLKKDYTPNDLNDIHTHGSLTPTQAQDLITQLNKSTFTEKASGLGVDQTKIGLTNEIKDAAHQAFGDPWTKVYSDYSKGINAVNSISDIVNLDKDATPTDINKSLNSVLKLNGTPEGKIILQNAVNEFKNASGIDLTQGTQAIGQILDKQAALDAASKPGFIRQVLNPTYLARSAVRYGIVYLGLRAIVNAVQGK